MFRAGFAAVMSVSVLLMLAGCASVTGEKRSAFTPTLALKGALVYRERIALPPDSIAVIELRDTASVGKQVPIPFELGVDRAALPSGKTYNLRGVIEQAGQVQWLVTVLLDGRELHGCGGDSAILLQGGEWGVVDIAGVGVVDGSRATLNFGVGQLEGSGSCNRYSGSYMLTGEGFSVSSKTAMTMMACRN